MKFSIITPSLNQAKYLNRTLNSVMLQTHSSYEHIVLDPGSKDGSIKIISDYVKNNPNAIFINEPDEGQVDAINKGMALSDGEILTWLNSDDYYLDANVLKNVSDIFSENSSVDIVYGRGEYIDERGKFIKEAHVDSSDHDLKERLSESIGILQPALFYRRRVFESIGGLDAAYNLSLDYEYWIRMAFFGHEFKYVNLKFVAATLHGDSKTIGQRGNQYSEICKLLLSYYGFVKPIWLKRYADFLMNANDGIINVEKTTSPAMFSTKKNLFQKYNATAESLYQALLNLDDEQAQKYLREWLDVNTMKTNKTVLTTSSDKYFDQLLTLIAGLHRTSVDEIDLIVIYDLSLTEEQRQKLFSIQDVIVLPFPLRYKREAWYFKPKSYVYKCAAMANWLTHAVKNDCFIWMDTGIVPLRSINELYSITDEMDAFFINHDDKSETPFPNVNFTHPVSLKKLGANATEALSEHICSCLIGCKVGGSYEKIFVEAFSRSLDRSISDWPKHLDGKEIEKINSKLNGELRQSIVSMSNVELVNISLNDVVDCYPYYGHRQDQSIYSIFAARYSAPILSALKYCCSTDESSVASKKNWETGSNCPNIHKSRIIPEFVKNSLTYHHRGTYSNYDGLLLRKGAVLAAQKNSMKEAKQVANPDEITFKKKNVEILSIIDFTFDRRENAQLDETNLIYHLFQNHFNRVMIDVGGHFGESSYKFAQRDWKIVAFEPDPENRKKFIEKLGHKKNVTLEARAVGETVEQAKVFYASDESTGISGMLKFRDSHKQVATVEVTTIEKVIKEHNIDHIDFLKIDVEGYDFGVLKGVPWDKIKPDVIECEFEDAKTNLLGHTWRDICDYLTGHGYTVYVSEWHPIVRYGIAHDWHTMKKYPCTLADAKAWGNLLAFKDDPGEAAIAEVIKKVTKFRHSEAGTGLKVAQEKTIQAVVKTASNSDTKLSTEKKVTNKMKEKKINLPLQTPALQVSTTERPFYANISDRLRIKTPALFRIGQVGIWGLKFLKRHLILSIVGFSILSVLALAPIISESLKPYSVYFLGLAGLLIFMTAMVIGASYANLMANRIAEREHLAREQVKQELLALLKETSGKQEVELKQALSQIKALKKDTNAQVSSISEHETSARKQVKQELLTLLIATNSKQTIKLNILQQKFNERLEQSLEAMNETKALKGMIAEIRKQLDEEINRNSTSFMLAQEQLEGRLDSKIQSVEESMKTSKQALEKNADILHSLETETISKQGVMQKEIIKSEEKINDLKDTLADAGENLNKLIIENDKTQNLFGEFQISLTEAKNNVAKFQQFNREFTRKHIELLQANWLKPLNSAETPQSLAYMAERINLIETSLKGRLATTIETAVLRTLVALAVQRKTLHVLEIGTLFGTGVAMIHDRARHKYENIHFTVIDPLEGYYGNDRPDILTGEKINEAVLFENLSTAKVPLEDFTLIKGFSTDDDVILAASKDKYDVLIIDGDHSYAGVKADFVNYAPLVKRSGYIIIDDYDTDHWPEIQKYVDEELLPREDISLIGSSWRTAVFRVIKKVKT